MNYWLFLCNSQGKGASRITGREIWEQRRIDKYWGLGIKTVFRRHLRKGDNVIFYVGGKGEHVFVGTGCIKDSAYSSSSLNKTERTRRVLKGQQESDYYVDFTKLSGFPLEVPAITLLSELNLFKETDIYSWGKVLQGGVRKLTEDDYNRLCNAGKSPNTMLRLPGDQDANWAFDEGRKQLVVHMARERDPRLRKIKFAQVPKKKPLLCEACGFDFQATYGV